MRCEAALAGRTVLPAALGISLDILRFPKNNGTLLCARKSTLLICQNFKMY